MCLVASIWPLVLRVAEEVQVVLQPLHEEFALRVGQLLHVLVEAAASLPGLVQEVLAAGDDVPDPLLYNRAIDVLLGQGEPEHVLEHLLRRDQQVLEPEDEDRDVLLLDLLEPVLVELEPQGNVVLEERVPVSDELGGKDALLQALSVRLGRQELEEADEAIEWVPDGQQDELRVVGLVHRRPDGVVRLVDPAALLHDALAFKPSNLQT